MITAGRLFFLAILLVGLACFSVWWFCLKMPGQSWSESDELATQQESGSAESLAKNTTPTGPENSHAAGSMSTESKGQGSGGNVVDVSPELTLPELLESYVTHLSETIGERNLGKYDELCEAADYIQNEFKELGYTPARQTFEVDGQECFNIDAQIDGRATPNEIIIIGAHYDSFVGTPGANDNGSGTAAMLALARHFKDARPDKSLRFVAFTNEEPPYFHTRGQMGSWVYAEKCAGEEQQIVAVLSLETMGYFSDEEDSQKYPAPLNLMYPSTGNFIGFVSNLASRGLQRRVIKTFRQHAKVPSEGASLPESTPGVGWSDHWSFWQEGYPGIMITDTAPFRYPHYHLASDTVDKIDFATMAKVVEGLQFVIADLVETQE